MSSISTFSIQNKTPRRIEGHLEPECWPFSIDVGESLMIRGTYDAEPPSIQLSDGENGPVFVAIFPGDGDVTVEKM